MKKAYFPAVLILLVLVADQLLKIWIKTNMYLGQEYFVFGDWFRIHFTENEGMAFGLTLGGDYGKIALSLFRIIAVLFIGVYLFHLLDKSTPKGLIASIALIFAGAMGNIIDSVFYGVVFSDSMSKVATFLPEAGGYSSLFHGRVVDMIYFPFYQGYLPGWVPFWGDTYFIFFRPVFNIADVAITVGVFMIIIFQKRYFKEEDQEDEALEQKSESPQVQ
ncbi:MAG: lipoprotein signal peptidase [Chitinophagales bacterium]|nr:lipoprotein signal peptidase [Chitinophagales bacterium]